LRQTKAQLIEKMAGNQFFVIFWASDPHHHHQILSLIPLPSARYFSNNRLEIHTLFAVMTTSTSISTRTVFIVVLVAIGSVLLATTLYTPFRPISDSGSGSDSKRGGEFRSLLRQSLHYFARPHQYTFDTFPPGPIDSSHAWLASDIRDTPERWTTHLDVPEQESAIRMVKHVAEQLSVSNAVADTHRLHEISRRTCITGAGGMQSALVTLISRLRDELSVTRRTGLGFHLLRDVPLDAFVDGDAGAEVFFYCLGLVFGEPGAQNNAEELLGHVRDQFVADSAHGNTVKGSIRQFKTNEFIDFHCDLADVVGLLCLHPAAVSGGASRIASSVSVYNELLRRNRTLAARLFKPMQLDSRNSSGINLVNVEPSRYYDGILRTFIHLEYFETVERHPDAYTLSDIDREVIRQYREIANDPTFALDMNFKRGDIQLISNHVVVHGRDAYDDGGDSQNQRHLLRLWLSIDETRGQTFGQQFSVVRAYMMLLLRFVKGKITARMY
jgi:Taurine catabolism dioxygenase TauD, TfdA family